MHRMGCVSLMLVILATVSLCRPMTELQSMRHSAQRKSPTISELSRRDLLSSLSHEEKQMMSQLLPQLYAELFNAEGHLHPMHDRDYAGWMDFGRRSSEDSIPDS